MRFHRFRANPCLFIEMNKAKLSEQKRQVGGWSSKNTHAAAACPGGTLSLQKPTAGVVKPASQIPLAREDEIFTEEFVNRNRSVPVCKSATRDRTQSTVSAPRRDPSYGKTTKHVVSAAVQPHRVEPARVRVGYDGVPIASVAARAGQKVRGASHRKTSGLNPAHPVPDSLSGSHGEWTNSDDVSYSDYVRYEHCETAAPSEVAIGAPCESCGVKIEPRVFVCLRCRQYAVCVLCVEQAALMSAKHKVTVHPHRLYLTDLTKPFKSSTTPLSSYPDLSRCLAGQSQGVKLKDWFFPGLIMPRMRVFWGETGLDQLLSVVHGATDECVTPAVACEVAERHHIAFAASAPGRREKRERLGQKPPLFRFEQGRLVPYETPTLYAMQMAQHLKRKAERPLTPSVEKETPAATSLATQQPVLLKPSVSHAVASALSGSHGEWTQADDVGKPRPRSREESSESSDDSRRRDDRNAQKRKSKVQETLKAADDKLVQEPKAAPQLDDDLKAYFARKPKSIVVRSTSPFMFAMFEGTEVTRLSDDRGLCHDGRVVAISTVKEGGFLAGYAMKCHGHYTLLPMPKDCITLEAYTRFEEEHIVSVREPGSHVALPIITLTGEDGKSVRLNASYEYVVDSLFQQCQVLSPGGAPTVSTYRAIVAKLRQNNTRINNELILSTVHSYMHTLVRNAVSETGEIVRVGTVIATVCPELFTKVRDIVHGEAHSTAMALSTQSVFSSGVISRDYDIFQKVPLAHKGYTWLGELDDGYTEETAKNPEDTVRFKFVRASSSGVQYWHPNLGAGTPHPLQFRFVGMLDFSENKVGYHSRGVTIIPEKLERMPTTIHIGPNEFSEGMNKRMLSALDDEVESIRRQLKIFFHIHYIDPLVADSMVSLVAKHSNNPRLILDLWTDEEEREAEIGPIRHVLFGATPCYEDDSPELRERIGRHGAALALVQRLHHMGRGKLDLVQSFVWMGVLLTFFCGFIVQCLGPESFTIPVKIMYTVGGTLSAIASIGAVMCVMTWYKGNEYVLDDWGFGHRVPAYHMGGSPWRMLATYLMRPHPKAALYINMFRRVFGKKNEVAKNDGIYLGKTRVVLQGKPEERSKWGKCCRIVGSCTTAILPLLGYAGTVKSLYAGAVDIGTYFAAEFSFPVMSAIHNIVYTMPAALDLTCTESNIMIYSFSDDELAIMKAFHSVTFVCADASSADATAGALLLIAYLPQCYFYAGFFHLVEAVVANFVGIWVAANPYNQKEFVEITPTTAQLPSGDGNTTHIQNTQTVCRVGAFVAIHNWSNAVFSHKQRLAATHRHNVEAMRPYILDEVAESSIKEGSRSVGCTSTVEVTPHMQTATFLKRTFYRSDCGEVVYTVCFGTIFRKWLSYYGDIDSVTLGLTSKQFSALSMAERWERFGAGIVAGLKNEPGNIILDAMRARYPSGKLLTFANKDEMYKQEQALGGRDNSAKRVSTPELQLRYGGNLADWMQAANFLEHQRFGDSVVLPIFDRFLMVDYGVE